MNVESGPRKEKAESLGCREERPELGDECGKLGLAVGARSVKDGLAPSAGGLHPAPPGGAGFPLENQGAVHFVVVVLSWGCYRTPPLSLTSYSTIQSFAFYRAPSGSARTSFMLPWGGGNRTAAIPKK